MSLKGINYYDVVFITNPGTRKMTRTCAAAHHYCPNRSTQNLKNQKNRSIRISLIWVQIARPAKALVRRKVAYNFWPANESKISGATLLTLIFVIIYSMQCS
jgi:hypothetical protein